MYGRATPIVRSRTITNLRKAAGHEEGTAEEVAALKPSSKDFIGGVNHAFIIRIASKHHIGVQREILGCLHASGVDVLEAHVLSVNHPSTEEVDAFVANYVVISRGAKKDFDDEKLEEIQHALSEILDDADSQVWPLTPLDALRCSSMPLDALRWHSVALCGPRWHSVAFGGTPFPTILGRLAGHLRAVRRRLLQGRRVRDPGAISPPPPPRCPPASSRSTFP